MVEVSVINKNINCQGVAQTKLSRFIFISKHIFATFFFSYQNPTSPWNKSLGPGGFFCFISETTKGSYFIK